MYLGTVIFHNYFETELEVNLNQGKIKLPKLHPSFFESGVSHSYPYLRNKYFMKERILKMEIHDCVAFM